VKPSDVRADIVRRLERDLVGPDGEEEIISGRNIKPSDVYLTGVLWPLGDRMDGADDDGSNGDDEEDDGPSSPGLVGQQRPCTMGLSFATEASSDRHSVQVSLSFATYSVEDAKDVAGKSIVNWKRQPFKHTISPLELPEEGSRALPVSLRGLEPDIRLHIRTKRTPEGLISTITLINHSRPERDKREMERHSLFQACISVEAMDGTVIVPRPGRRVANDEDEESAQLLFRNCPEFAAGHQCSVGWDSEGGARRTTRVYTRWLPSAVVPGVRERGHDVFRPAVEAGSFNASELANCSDGELARRLNLLPQAYREWIILQEGRITSLPKELQRTSRANLDNCDAVQKRIAAGASRVLGDKDLRLAFRIANAAMALQHGWKKEVSGPLVWYPFQLGFILLAGESTCNPESVDRAVLDLLWFPTGGGKTEAYLALVAMLAVYRRLRESDPDRGAGNAALMRYTLRLLTAQQFERAAALILACDLIRVGSVDTALGGRSLGQTPFSIGLWVGEGATPNTFEDALAARGQRDGSTAEQIDLCPCCTSRVRWEYDEGAEQIHPRCENDACLLGPSYGLWPVFTVDSDVYRERPTLLLGTVDKFALVPTREEAGRLFDLGGERPPDLVIQDELHLISGPLGTIAGLYETAFDWLISRAGYRPKVIGSTATIRRARQQVLALFDRVSCQFPPPAIDHDDSGFAVREDSPEKPGRIYVGVTTAGRSAKFALQAVAGSLLQSASPVVVSDPALRDGYSTLLCYFNSLRELGGAIVQMLDDVPDSIGLYARRRNETPRSTKEPRELTSRVSQKEIVRILGELKRNAANPEAVDVVLATNMVSVGVDVPRLGLMLVNGQPKTRSEYIQATSRVGRSRYPGLIVSVLNAAKARDRSHYETYPAWHATLYRDVEATSVTPFASRARDRALHAALVSMIRHGIPGMLKKPDLGKASDQLLQAVIAEIERRVDVVDSRELGEVRRELDERMQDWDGRAPKHYNNYYKPNESLLQSADRYARRRAAGRTTGSAWPTMNNMRSVEPGTRFRMAEVLRSPGSANRASGGPIPEDGQTGQSESGSGGPRWRRNG
jgi:hypothetical protein